MRVQLIPPTRISTLSYRRRGVVAHPGEGRGNNIWPFDHPGRSPGWGLIYGYYPGYTNTPPAAYLERGRDICRTLFPRTSAGAIDWDNGLIGIADFGGSPSHLIWGAKQALPGANESRYIRYARTARPGYALRTMIESNLPEYSDYWNNWVPTRLTNNGLVAAQVGLAFLENGWAFGPSGAVAENQHYPDPLEYIETLRDGLLQLRDEVVARFPNLRLVLFTNLYPFHYSERASVMEQYIMLRYFAMQRIIHDFINSGEYSTAPYWMGWGPDWWLEPGFTRSDGFAVRRSYYKSYADSGESDGVHPNTTGLNYFVPAVLEPYLTRTDEPQELAYTSRADVPTTMLSSLNSTTAKSTYSLPAFDFPGGVLVLLGVQNSVSSGTPNVPAVSSGGITWTQVNTRVQGVRRVTLFRATSASAVPGVVLTVNFAGQTQASCRAYVLRIDGADWDASDMGVVQTAANSVSSNTTLTVTLPNTPAARNTLFASWHTTQVISADSESTLGPYSGLLYSTWRGNGPANGQIAITQGTAGVMIGIAVEIRRA